MGMTSGAEALGSRTSVERSDRELVVSRTFDAPARLVFEAWTRAELFQRWWVPKSAGITLLSCELDVRTGGTYRLEFARDGGGSMAFFGRYLDVVPNARIVWTNEEEGGGAVTTVTLEETDGRTRLVFSELYPSREALDEVFVGMEGGIPEQLEQLDALLASLPQDAEAPSA